MIASEGRDDIERFRTLIGQRVGLRFEDGKAAFLSGVLSRRLKKRGCDSTIYFRWLSDSSAGEEWGELARELTIGETYFFRNIEQFRALAEIVLPKRHQLRAGRPLRILSVGCSTGEEAYSLAIVLRETLPETWQNAEIYAADINPFALEKAGRAQYTTWALRETPADLKSRWFHIEGTHVGLDPSISRAVRFETCNLASDASETLQRGSYDVIFCRNALMYFDPAQMIAAVERIADALAPGGFLFLGHAETLRGVSERFQIWHTHNTFYYERKPSVTSERDRTVTMPLRIEHPSDIRVGGDTGWFEDIRRASERVAALVPKGDPDDAGVSLPVTRFDTASVLDLLRKEQFDIALKTVREGVTAAGSDPELSLIEATLLMLCGQFDQAQNMAAELLLGDDGNAGAHYIIALCQEHIGHSERAMAHHRHAARLDPSFAMPRLHMGLLARHAGDDATARKEFARATLLLEAEEPHRLVLFGGGFSREALMTLCSTAIEPREARK